MKNRNIQWANHENYWLRFNFRIPKKIQHGCRHLFRIPRKTQLKPFSQSYAHTRWQNAQTKRERLFTMLFCSTVSFAHYKLWARIECDNKPRVLVWERVSWLLLCVFRLLSVWVTFSLSHIPFGFILTQHNTILKACTLNQKHEQRKKVQNKRTKYALQPNECVA